MCTISLLASALIGAFFDQELLTLCEVRAHESEDVLNLVIVYFFLRYSSTIVFKRPLNNPSIKKRSTTIYSSYVLEPEFK